MAGTADEERLAHLSSRVERLLTVVEGQQEQGKLEFVLVIVLALTALGSTWCAYQSQLWNGTQLVRLADAEIATQLANEGALAAMQRTTLHGTVLLHYVDAMHRGDTVLAEAIHMRMESPLREAVDAWLKLDPFHNPSAPRVRDMAEYVLPELVKSKEEGARAADLRTKALSAGSNGDSYVLLTLMFASVLFFGGITGTFRSRRLRVSLASIACAMFLATVGWAATMPVCGG